MGEQEIIAGIKQNDQNAFRQLVDQYQELVLNTCYGFVNSRDDALDLSQDVFIEVYNSISKFRGEAKISTWLYRIAVNKSLNFIRKNKREKFFGNLDKILNKGNEVASPAMFNADSGIENNEKASALKIAIDSLPRNQKIAFTLHKAEGVSYQDISAIMNISISSVESLIHRAKRGLQKKLLNFYTKNME